MMPTARSNESVDTTPLLTNAVTDHIFRSRRFIRRPPSLRGVAQFLGRASSGRMMREPSMRVRESAAQQIEERQSDWAYSRPIVVLDLVWNLAFVLVSIFVLIMSWNEIPAVPLRLWIVGYGFQCVLHMVCVCMEYKRRYYQRFLGDESSEVAQGSGGGGWWSSRNLNSSSGSDGGEDGEYVSQSRQNEDEPSVAKNLESANSVFSFIWWIIGFYWIAAGGETLTHDSPQLYWLCITFLAFDVFFVIICVAVACVIGIAVCCCLPCIIAILYAVADQEGAAKDILSDCPNTSFGESMILRNKMGRFKNLLVE